MVGRILRRSAFTLVELLVVIAIIGILVALLLPAVQSAREAARRLQCKNHIKQLSLGAIMHMETHGYFPGGGWGWHYAGDPNAGFGQKQPGGWCYSVLPYVEQISVHDMGKSSTDAVRKAEQAKAAAIPISIFNCPSRRPCKARPFVHGTNFNNTDRPPAAQRTDYAACAGTGGQNTSGIGEPAEPTESNPFEISDGIVATKSEYSPGDVKDGMSNTYLIGERYLMPDHYDTGKASDDDQHQYVGFDRDTVRWGTISLLPMQDRPGYDALRQFGSAHSGSWQMSFCDGSVHSLSYSIDPTTHQRLAGRKDGLPIDASKY